MALPYARRAALRERWAAHFVVAHRARVGRGRAHVHDAAQLVELDRRRNALRARDEVRKAVAVVEDARDGFGEGPASGLGARDAVLGDRNNLVAVVVRPARLDGGGRAPVRLQLLRPAFRHEAADLVPFPLDDLADRGVVAATLTERLAEGAVPLVVFDVGLDALGSRDLLHVSTVVAVVEDRRGQHVLGKVARLGLRVRGRRTILRRSDGQLYGARERVGELVQDVVAGVFERRDLARVVDRVGVQALHPWLVRAVVEGRRAAVAAREGFRTPVVEVRRLLGDDAVGRLGRRAARAAAHLERALPVAHTGVRIENVRRGEARRRGENDVRGRIGRVLGRDEAPGRSHRRLDRRDASARRVPAERDAGVALAGRRIRRELELREERTVRGRGGIEDVRFVAIRDRDPEVRAPERRRYDVWERHALESAVHVVEYQLSGGGREVLEGAEQAVRLRLGLVVEVRKAVDAPHLVLDARELSRPGVEEPHRVSALRGVVGRVAVRDPCEVSRGVEVGLVVVAAGELEGPVEQLLELERQAEGCAVRLARIPRRVDRAEVLRGRRRRIHCLSRIREAPHLARAVVIVDIRGAGAALRRERNLAQVGEERRVPARGAERAVADDAGTVGPVEREAEGAGRGRKVPHLDDGLARREPNARARLDPDDGRAQRGLRQ